MDYPIRAESGKGRSAHIFNLNERAVNQPDADLKIMLAEESESPPDDTENC